MQNAWNERLKSPIFDRVEMSKYFFEIERKFQLEGRGSAVDLEIFSNAALLNSGRTISDETRLERLEQLEELLRRFRKTEQTCLMMGSTHHAAARAFVDGGHTDSLMRILNSPVEFGIFPDDYTYTYLLNHFLSSDNFRDGAKVAVAMMLQEEYKIPVASQMGLYSTYAYVQNVKEATEPWDPQPAAVVEEPEDEVKIRVAYLESPYKDDHFDLTSRDHLLGKTLAKFSVHGLLNNHPHSQLVRNSLEILGWTLFEKWDKVLALCHNNSSSNKLALECIRQATALAEENSSEESTKAAQSLGQLTHLDEMDVKAVLEEEVVRSAAESEAKFIQVKTKFSNLVPIKKETSLMAG